MCFTQVYKLPEMYIYCAFCIVNVYSRELYKLETLCNQTSF